MVISRTVHLATYYERMGVETCIPKLGHICSCGLGILIVPVEFVRRIVSFCTFLIFHLLRSLMTLTKSLDA
jgi:hypothetical protein